jgi:hypothetical protein
MVMDPSSRAGSSLFESVSRSVSMERTFLLMTVTMKMLAVQAALGFRTGLSSVLEKAIELNRSSRLLTDYTLILTADV